MIITIDIFNGKPNPAYKRSPLRNRKSILFLAFLLSLLFAFTVHTSAQQDKSAEAEKVLEEGVALFKQGTAESLRAAFTKFDESRRLAHSTDHKEIEASSLLLMGKIANNLGDKQNALDYFNRALPLWREVGDKSREATTLNNIGLVYDDLGEKQKALNYYNQALPLRKTVGDKSGEAVTLHNLMFVWYELGNPRFAVFYGKQAINAYQRLRANISGLDREIQKTFLKSVESSYRYLANILIEQGRIPEAEQVLAMLKEEEYFAYLRRDDNVAKSLLRTASLTPDEAESIKRYNELADRITAVGKEYGELYQEKRKPEYEDKAFPQQARLGELKQALDDATVAFSRFLEDLKITFGKEDKRVAEVESGLQSMLKSMNMKHTAIVSTIVGDDRLNIFITTADTQRAHTIEIKAAAVNKLVAEFRAAVTNAQVDPHNAGKKLYDILVGPIEKDLAGINADTIVWSLDGTLRYAPVAALWDGLGYLVQRYSNVIITLASQKNLEKEITDKSLWRALGVGVSKEYENFLALSAVPDELDCIVTDQVGKVVSVNPICQSGVVNGKKLIDESFTKNAFIDAMGRDYRLVHIASHFSMQPGDIKDSFLLLGGGNDRKLSVNEIKQSMFNGVELLTLSACNTAVGGEKSNGV